VPPNVLLIVFDTARADAFEPYGAGVGASPTIGQLARRGAAWPSMIAPSNWTMPSHASMFAGALPLAIGLAGAPDGRAEGCRPVMQSLDDRLLQSVLARAGYATVGISCNAWISHQTGFDQGFERFYGLVSRRTAKMHGHSIRGRLEWAIESIKARVDDGAGDAESIIADLLDEGPKQPFFWFVNLVECHSPYMPPRPYNDLSMLQRLRVGSEARRHLTLTELWRAALSDFDTPPGTVGRMRHLYGRSIRLMDDWLARILDRLEKRKVLDDTIVIVTSDHGENFGEGGQMGHSFSLDQRLTWIPFVVTGPDAPKHNGVESLASLPRLLADAIGLGDHPWGAPAVPPGIGIAQYVPSAKRGDQKIEAAITDWNLGEDAIVRMTQSATSATDLRWKVVRNGDTYRSFDLAADALEADPVSDAAGLPEDSRLALQRLRAAVDQADSAAVTPVTDGRTPPPSSDELKELEDRLRELGYL
jgi:arylsulfatase A-like enzyme